jgi:hypothetical protein
VILAGRWAEAARERTALAAADALQGAQPCDHFSTSSATVDRIASNRRVMGADGKVAAVRWTKTADPAVRAAPEGTIDPELKTVGFWDGGTPLAFLHYYAVHPTSKDRTGVVTPEFVGLARDRRSAADGVPHLYFTACAGNVTAGKYNDGIVDNRELFASRIETAMQTAVAASVPRPLSSVGWVVERLRLPPRADLNESALLAQIGAPTAAASAKVRSKAAMMLTYLRRRDRPIPITCLRLADDAAILNLPGETFIEYQLHAQRARPDSFITVAGYSDLGPCYITLEKSFDEGGYEPIDAFVSGESEAILRAGIDTVLLA